MKATSVGHSLIADKNYYLAQPSALWAAAVNSCTVNIQAQLLSPDRLCRESILNDEIIHECEII